MGYRNSLWHQPISSAFVNTGDCSKPSVRIRCRIVGAGGNAEVHGHFDGAFRDQVGQEKAPLGIALQMIQVSDALISALRLGSQTDDVARRHHQAPNSRAKIDGSFDALLMK